MQLTEQQGLRNAGKTAIRVGGLSGSFAAAETFALKKYRR